MYFAGADLQDLEGFYQALPVSIRTMANSYRDHSGITYRRLPNDPLTPNFKDSVNVLLGAPGGEGELGKTKASVYVYAANKVKHRFTVVEFMDVLSAAADPTKPIPYVSGSYEPQHTMTWYGNTAVAAGFGADLVTFLLMLDGHGVPL